MSCGIEELKSVMEWAAVLIIVVVWNIAAAWLVTRPSKKGGGNADR